MVIAAVSGQAYEDYCQHNILQPIGVTDAVIPPYWEVVAPFGGWRMTLADVVKLRSVFDIEHPTILSRATLSATLLGHLGGRLNSAGLVYYTLGVFVHQDRPGGPYVVDHDGFAGFGTRTPTEYMFVETLVPGYTWILAASPAPPIPWVPSIAREVRQMLKTARAE